MRISREQWDALVAHAREEDPYECCGYGRVEDGLIAEVFRGTSERRSKWGFSFDFKTLMAANELEDEGFGVAVYHSHPKSAPVPSEQDRNVAQYPQWLNLIVSLAGEPEIRAWWIVDGDVTEEPLEVE
ncbi:MAG TPA: M67 family metallopeptidase [Thermoleophilaceae bacterium]|jgi:proteasome lid subunit RPN8/RPN11